MYNHQLDTFVRVADMGSFSKAAEAAMAENRIIKLGKRTDFE